MTKLDEMWKACPTHYWGGETLSWGTGDTGKLAGTAVSPATGRSTESGVPQFEHIAVTPVVNRGEAVPYE